MEDLKVHITRREGRKFWQAYYLDPLSGRQKFRSTKAVTKREAERFAGKWESELRSGNYKAASKITWEEFKERFISGHCSGLAPRTLQRYQVAFSSLELLISPKLLRDVTAEAMSEFQTKLRSNALAEATIACHLRHVKAALRWAADMEMIPEAPKVKMPKRVKGASVMKGRPITGEEFDRMIAKTHDGLFIKAKKKQAKDRTEKPAKPPKDLTPEQIELREQVVESWRFFLRGLWWSGLRISEAIDLTWDGGGIVVRLEGKRPMLMIPAEAEKGHKDRLLPITPDFAQFLEAVPQAERRGKVFKVLRRDGKRLVCPFTIGKRVTDIGAAAGVKVKDEGGKVKFASAHDLRRAFGNRWSKLVMPAVLKTLMRHGSIQTTMAYYVGQEAESVADAVWKAAILNGSMNTGKNEAASQKEENPQVFAD